MDEAGLTSFFGVYAPGNLSARITNSNRILITPSGLPKGKLKPDDLVMVDIYGRKIKGKYKPSIETPLHCAIYRQRTDVNGVVHVHAPMSLAYAIAHKEVPATTIELAAVTGGNVPIAPYATPATEELAKITAARLGLGSAVLMANHGLVAVGQNLDEAFNIALSVEYTAAINIYAKIIGEVKKIPLKEVSKIRKFIVKRYGQK